MDDEELYVEAVRIVREENRASATQLQRRLKIGYVRACFLLEQMEKNGIIGPSLGANPRQVLKHT